MQPTKISKCRLCFENGPDLIDMFCDQGKLLNISYILLLHFSLEINEDDPLSKEICSPCWSTIENFHIFYNKILEIQNLKPFDDIEIKIETTELIKSENELDSNLWKENSIKVLEEHSINENLINNDDDDNEHSDLDYEENFSEHHISDSVESREPSEEKRKPTRKRKLNKNSNKLNSKEEKTKDRAQTLKEDKQIYEFYNMNCELCSVVFEKFQHVKTHYRTVHKIDGYLSCCNEKFYRRFRALEHAQRHIDPNSFRCNICQKQYKNKSGYQNHLDTHKSEDEKPFKCNICNKSYVKKYLYHRHLKLHIPESKEKIFKCDTCSKSFSKNLSLQSHIRTVHNCVYSYVCEICAKTFKTKPLYDQHCQLVHSGIDLPKVQCQQCGKWAKNELSLRYHMRLHEDQDKEHKCQHCGKLAPNKRALRKHIRYIHVIERKHKCTMCDKAFKYEIGLKEHMATHTGEVLYSCDYCPKTFNSNANMHAHIKKLHPIEWEEKRIKRENRYNPACN